MSRNVVGRQDGRRNIHILLVNPSIRLSIFTSRAGILTKTSDKLLQYPSTTPELYGAKVAPLVEKAMNGFNSTIFA